MKLYTKLLIVILLNCSIYSGVIHAQVGKNSTENDRSKYNAIVDSSHHYLYVNKENALIGDMVLTESRNQLEARNSYGALLKKISVSKCVDENGECVSSINTYGIQDVKATKDMITVTAIVNYNCCMSILADIKIENHVLDLQYIPYGEYCYCKCPYEVTYVIDLKEVRENTSGGDPYKVIKKVSLQGGRTIVLPK